MIDPTAIIHPTAEVAEDVEVGPFCVIRARARVARGNRLLSHVVVGEDTELGPDNECHPGSVIGGPPQDKTWRGETTRAVIGAGNVFREGVTINRGTVKGGGVTAVGDGNLFMAFSHAGHDCRIGNEATLSNAVLLAGHCVVGDRAVLGGAVACHHFVRIGRYAYLGGMTRCVHDVPPFCKAAGDPVRVRGLNLVGLRRGGVEGREIAALEQVYRRVFRSEEPLRVGLEDVDAPPDSLAAEFLTHLREWVQAPKGRYLEQFRTDRRTSP